MLTSLFLSHNTIPKSLKLTALLLFFPLSFFAQSLTGLWTGVLTNDSNSVRKDQSFEIALTEYRGKVYGYSRSEFIVNDTLYYVLKRVKGTINGDMCEVKDDEIISYNFRNRLDKGVKISSIFYRNKKDSSWYLAGKWKTNQTKNYYSVTGKVDLKGEKDLSASKIFPHLEELRLSNDVAFYNDRKKETGLVIMKTVEPENIKYETSVKAEEQPIITNSTALSTTPDTKSVEIKTVAVTSTQIIRTNTIPVKTVVIAVPAKTEVDIAKTEPFPEPERQKSIIKPQEQESINKLASVFINPNTKNVTITTIPVTSTLAVRTTTEPMKPKTIAIPTKTSAAIVTSNPVIPAKNSGIKNSLAEANKLTALMEERKSEFSQVVNFKSDSLELALYDNGEIDGDTVSVFLNGEVILAKQGLKASAIKKTIYITPDIEDFTLVLFAENLGKYPPNTGLLVVHDGDDVYNVRFTADFQKNAGVVFKRKRSQ